MKPRWSFVLRRKDGTAIPSSRREICWYGYGLTKEEAKQSVLRQCPEVPATVSEGLADNLQALKIDHGGDG